MLPYEGIVRKNVLIIFGNQWDWTSESLGVHYSEGEMKNKKENWMKWIDNGLSHTRTIQVTQGIHSLKMYLM